uniref:Permease n=1 Tax=Solibacter usitatus (strain Ellin6076) TaxID=234267 RepID=Q020Z0_SOLUE
MSWRRYFRRRAWDEERARELDTYLADETDENIARGMTPDAARLAAQRRLGNTTSVREEIYRMNSLSFLETFWQDLRYGLRVLWKSPGITAVALLSLALGIGATTAIFSVVYGVLISPYPYAKANEIWAPEIHNAKEPNQARYNYHVAEYLQVRKLPAFAEVMATSPENRLLAGGLDPESFTSVLVTSNAFHFLGVKPLLGRTIVDSDIKPNGEAEPVIVLSYRAWQRLFQGSPDALGKTVTLNEVRYFVIGVMPPRFGWWTSDGAWLPMPLDPRQERPMFTIARLQPGVSQRVAEQQLQALHLDLAKQRPADFPKAGFNTVLRNYLDITVAQGEMQSSLQLLFGAVGFLLLIACANVANLQMARATARKREIALRMAVGAGASRVLRQLLTESVALSLAGGALGILFAMGLTRAIVLLMPEFYVPNEARIEVNGYVLAFSAAISVITGIVFGLAPARECARLQLVETLKDAGKGAGGSGVGGQQRNLLVIAEVALSVVLLMGASLAVRGFVELQRTDVGFQADRVLILGIPVVAKRYPTYEQRIGLTESVLQRMRETPGVEAAAIGNGGLPFGGAQSGFSLEGQAPVQAQRILIGLVSADYSRTLGIPLRAGRTLTEQEVAHAEPVALINETASRLWTPPGSAIGRRIRLDFLDRPGNVMLPPGGATPTFTVVGILADTRNAGLKNPVSPAIYVPYTVAAPTGRTLAVRTRGGPMMLLKAVRQALAQVDKDLPVNRPITLEEVLGFETVQPRFNMALFTFFGLLGLALALVGIFSVLSYAVARRTHEIGVRMALGAERGDVLGLMLRMGARLVLWGLGLGLAGSFALARVLRSQVFQVPVTDWLAITAVVALLSGAAFLACLLPALRAARLNPMIALRHE